MEVRALERDDEERDGLVEDALLEKALGGDLRAQMYWLNNRLPDKWSDKPADRSKNGADRPVNILVDV